jgi:glycosyltransferase involved in cell wall biosynthesis
MRGAVGDSRLSILLVMAPGTVGGLETVVTALATGLTRRRHAVMVAASLPAPLGGHPVLDGLREGGVNVVLTPLSRSAERRALIALAGESGAGIVHSHGYRSDVLVRSARAAIGKPIVSTVHGFTGAGAKGRFYEWLQVRALRGFDGVIAVSRPLGAELGESGIGPATLRVIPNALPAMPRTVPPEAARARLLGGSAPSRPLIGWVGRLGPEKGCDVFIEALAAIREDDWTAVVVGSGPERPRLEELARRVGVEGRVVWAGTIPAAGELFPGFDVFALSSRTEGTPMVVLEAMAAGVPVVASAVGGIPDMLEQGAAGWLVEPGDPVALGGALRQAFAGTQQARSRVARAASRITQVYGIDPWLDHHEALYAGLIDGVRTGPSPA